MRSPEGSAVADAVVCEGLVRLFGERRALDGLDLRVGAGETLLVTGGNGAGKTTLLRVLATVLRPNGGTAAVWGHELPREAQAVRPTVGYVGHEPLVYPALTAQENLELYAALHGVNGSRVAEALQLVGLERRAGDRTAELSRGMRQRLALARAWLHGPSLLLLDEPTAGLDAEGRDVLRALLAGREGAALIATHEPEWFDGLATGAVRMEQGRAAA
ncbi:MAG: heme exporter protein [Gaiellales bacterium]|jgi:heme ABC exporter ATP-binding subunit CcmA|nr:heme exporter protein [Gaiellales bacterium]